MAIAVVAFAILTYWVTTTFDEVPKAVSQGVQPASYPRLLLGLLVAMSAVLFVQALKGEPSRRRLLPRRAIYSAIVLVGAVCLIPYVGVVVFMIGACAVLPLMWGERRHWVTAIYAIGFPLAVYGLFHGVLAVQFPLGVFRNLF